MRADLANLNHYAVPLLSRAAVNLCWYYYIYIYIIHILYICIHTYIRTAEQNNKKRYIKP